VQYSASLTNTETGLQAGSPEGGFFPTIFDRFLLDNSTAKTWPQMTDAERVASAINDRNLVWNGPQVTAAVVLPPLAAAVCNGRAK